MTSPVSVIIPVKNAEQTLRGCLDALFRAEGAERDVIIVDDGCDDDSLRIAASFPCRIIKNERKGVSAARNTGAKTSTGEILFFMDSDIIVPSDVFHVLSGYFADRTVDGITGLLGPGIRFDNFASKFKNLWMHYTYVRLTDFVSLFYTSAAAIRRGVFEKMGGFNEDFHRPNVEDTEFGRRLVAAGFRIRLARDLQVEHRKYYDCRGVLRTDFARSSGLVKVVLAGRGMDGRVNSTSVPSLFIASIPFFILSLLSLIASLFLGWKWVIAAGILFMVFLLANLPLLRFFRQKEGSRFALKSLLFLVPDILSVTGGIIHGFSRHLFAEKRENVREK